MGRLTAALSVAVLCAVLAACGSEAAAPPPQTPSPSGSPSASSLDPSQSPTPPAMPAAAKQHTEEGAKAFVVYFWQTVDFATMHLAPDSVRPLIRDDCSGCQAGVDFITDAKRRDAKIVGGNETVGSVTAEQVQLGSDTYYSVKVTISNTAQRVRYADGKSKTFPASTVTDHLMLHPAPGGWVVASLEAA